MSRIVQVANFVGPHSGGIRTVLANLAAGYACAGHEVLQIVPGEKRRRTRHDWGERLELPGHVLPGTGYQVLTVRAVAPALAAGTHRLEVHDRTTLRGLGAFARRAGIGSLVVSHERLDRLVEQWTRNRFPARRPADASNKRLSAEFDAVVCTTDWAAAEFQRLSVPNLSVVPLGVDHVRFSPRAAEHAHWRRFAPDGAALLAMAIRLSPEKRPAIAVDTVRQLLERERPAHLLIAGDGPLRGRLERQARGLPITFLGHLPGDEVAAVLASADVALAPGPVETFGLAALEALACGTPVVVNRRSALPSVVGTAGRAADGCGTAFADAVQEVLAQPAARTGAAARARALEFDWTCTVAGFLAVHGLTTPSAVAS
jgi:alpha-1,6-mannosyltransferase